MRHTILLLVFLGAISQAIGQQAPQYSLYALNPLRVNPAYAGLGEGVALTGVMRQQWTQLDGAPATQQFNLHLPWYFVAGGLGLSLENDRIGAERQVRVDMMYARHFQVGKEGLLSLGLSGGFLQKTLDGSRLRTPGGNYEGGGLDHNDAALPLNRVSDGGVVWGAGVFYRRPSWEVGLAAQDIAFGDLSLGEVNYGLDRSYLLFGSGWIPLSRQLTLMPSVLVKTDVIQWQADFSAVFYWKDNIFGGLSFRGYNSNSADAGVLIAGLRIGERLVLAYSYDLTISELRAVNSGSHEFMVSYRFDAPFGKGKLPPVIYHPRSKW